MLNSIQHLTLHYSPHSEEVFDTSNKHEAISPHVGYVICELTSGLVLNPDWSKLPCLDLQIKEVSTSFPAESRMRTLYLQ